MAENLKIGITQGDPAGIGWEVILKMLSDPRMADLHTLVVYGSPAAADCYRKRIGALEVIPFQIIDSPAEARRGKANLIPCGDMAQVEPGRPSAEAGRAAVEALQRAAADLEAGLIDALVTGPIDKETAQGDGFRCTGHTEYFGARFGGEPMMILCSERLRVGLVTKHIPVSEIPAAITREKIVADLLRFRATLKQDFGIVEPRIAVLALNPHAGEGGMLGREEEEIIRPAVLEAVEKGVLAFGPFAADGLFGSGAYARYDGVLAMYHDQGLAPFKTISPDGVNFTAGLPVVRTSPGHGTAFDIAGQNLADAASLRHAVYMAQDILMQRRAWAEWSANPLPRAERRREAGEGAGSRDNRNGSGTDNRERREPRESREAREPREPREAREPREPREAREPREPREARESREPRERRNGRNAARQEAAAQPEAEAQPTADAVEF